MGAAVILLSTVLLWAFSIFDWNHGIARAGFLVGYVVFIAIFCRTHFLSQLNLKTPQIFAQWYFRLIPLLLLCGLALTALTWIQALIYTQQTGLIRMDQGQILFRSAKILSLGENPYGRGMLLDPRDFYMRLSKRVSLGIVPQTTPEQLNGLFDEYWRTMDPSLRIKLLPIADAQGTANQEVSMLGYRYGPIPLLVATALVGIEGPLAIPLINGFLTFLLLAVVALILKERGCSMTVVITALTALSIDPHIRHNYFELTATDTYPLTFSFLGLLMVFRQRPIASACFFAIAMGSKTFPSLLFLPFLLLLERRGLSLTILLGMLALIFGPWLIWDAHGIFLNLWLWPTLTTPDSSSWIHLTPESLITQIRIVGLILIACFYFWWIKHLSDRHWFWLMVCITAIPLLTGPFLHNNYLPWISIWGVMALSDQLAEPHSLKRSMPIKPGVL